MYDTESFVDLTKDKIEVGASLDTKGVPSKVVLRVASLHSSFQTGIQNAIEDAADFSKYAGIDARSNCFKRHPLVFKRLNSTSGFESNRIEFS